MKAHHSAGRDHHSFARAGVPSLASALTSNREGAKAVDGDWFTRLKGGLEEFKEPVQQGGCLRLRDPCLPMNSPGNVRLLHRRSLPLRSPINLPDPFARPCDLMHPRYFARPYQMIHFEEFQ